MKVLKILSFPYSSRLHTSLKQAEKQNSKKCANSNMSILKVY